MKNIILKIYEKLLHITIVTVITLTFVSSAYASPAFSISKTEWQTIVNHPFTLGWQLSTTDGIKATQFGLWENPITSFDDAPCLFIPNAQFYDATVPEAGTVALIALGLIVLISGRRKGFYR